MASVLLFALHTATSPDEQTQENLLTHPWDATTGRGEDSGLGAHRGCIHRSSGRPGPVRQGRERVRVDQRVLAVLRVAEPFTDNAER